jgi:hypothetical protein
LNLSNENKSFVVKNSLQAVQCSAPIKGVAEMPFQVNSNGEDLLSFRIDGRK